MRALAFIVTGMLAAPAAWGADAEALLRRYDCHLCHARNEAGTGPAYVDIAAKYRANPKAVAILTAIVRKGTHGNGPWHMPPLPQVPDGDARQMVEFILATPR